MPSVFFRIPSFSAASLLPFFISLLRPSIFLLLVYLYFHLNHSRPSLRLRPRLFTLFFFSFFFYSFAFFARVFHDFRRKRTRTIHESYRRKRWCHFLNLDIAETGRSIAVLLPRGTDIIDFLRRSSRRTPRRHLPAINFCSFFRDTSLSLSLSLSRERKSPSPQNSSSC